MAIFHLSGKRSIHSAYLGIHTVYNHAVIPQCITWPVLAAVAAPGFFPGTHSKGERSRSRGWNGTWLFKQNKTVDKHSGTVKSIFKVVGTAFCLKIFALFTSTNQEVTKVVLWFRCWNWCNMLLETCLWLPFTSGRSVQIPPRWTLSVLDSKWEKKGFIGNL